MSKPKTPARPNLSQKDRTALTRVARMRALPHRYTDAEREWLSSERVVGLVAAAGGEAAVDAILPPAVRAEAKAEREAHEREQRETVAAVATSDVSQLAPETDADAATPRHDPTPGTDVPQLPEGPAHFLAIEETPALRHHRKRLGRHVWHDPRSRAFPAERAAVVKDVMHRSRVGCFDQGNVGSCTGEAGEGLVSTAPFKENGNQRGALALYEAATRVDGIPGEYPPDDTGSSGLAVARVLKAQGRIASYTHAFGLQHLLEALTLGPGMVGMKWLTGCDAPNKVGVVRYEGDLRGGHEVCAVGLSVARRLVWFRNSWGPDFGVKGYFAMSWDDLEKALADQGDAIFCRPKP